MRMRVPAALAALMAVALVLGVTWTAVTPPFQAPDEQSHFAYTQFLAERFELPGEPARQIYSSEHIRAASAVNADQVAGQPLTPPEWSDTGYRRWQGLTRADAPDDGGGNHSASTYPPASYGWQSIGYRLASGGDFFDKLSGARLFSVLWLPITVLATWLLAGELFGRRRLPQLAAASVPALAPMLAFVSGSVSPDGMLYALWTVALWLGVRCLRHGLRARGAAAFFAVVGLACVTKPVSYALLPGALLVLAVGLWRLRPSSFGAMARRAGAAAVALALTLGAWIVLARALDRPAAAQVAGATASAATDWRELLSYVWQYYLPRTPAQTDAVGPDIGYRAFRVWIVQGWGAFGWLEIRFADNVYRVLAILTAGVGAAALASAWRARRRLDLAVVAFLALVAISLLAGLHWSDYRALKAGGGGFMQARYLFPLIGLMGCALAAAAHLVPARARAAAVGATVAGLLVFHLFSLGLVLQRFYA